MNREFLLPPSRDLPPNRLAERREHLISELAPRRADSPSGRSPRLRIVAFVAAALIVLVGSASAIGGIRELILDHGFLGLAPEGATPSTPDSGELVLHYFGRSASHGKGIARPLVQLWVYADGRLIWSEESGHSAQPPPEGANELVTGYLEQRLTPDGLELLRSQVAEFMERSRAAVETLPDDFDPLDDYDPLEENRGLALFIANPLDSGVSWGSVQLRDGDGFAGLSWMGKGDANPKFHGPTATPEQVADILRIDELLTDRESVLPVSAWAVRKIRAYVPSHYAACFFPPPKDQSQALSLLPTAAADLFRDKSPRREDVFSEYCFKLTTEEARAVAASLSGFKRDTEAQGSRLAYQLRDEEGWPDAKSIWFEPYFPHGEITCSACG